MPDAVFPTIVAEASAAECRYVRCASGPRQLGLARTRSGLGNSPLNFADPSGYCFMGCFWKSAVHAIRQALTNIPILRTAIQIAVSAVATAVCGPGCAAVASGLTSSAISGLTGGSFSASLRSGLISVTTALAFNAVGTDTLGPDHATPSLLSDAHIANIAGHAAVGCLSSVASGGKCGQGAASAAAGSFGAPLLVGQNIAIGTAISAGLGGLASVATGGKFATGAETAAFGYLFNSIGGWGARAGYLAGTAVGAACAILSEGACTPFSPWFAASGAVAGEIAGTVLEVYLVRQGIISAGFSAAEIGVINEAGAVLGDSALASLRAAYQAGTSAEVSIGGRTIIYAPELNASGMTLFGENGFVLGRSAFSSAAASRSAGAMPCM